MANQRATGAMANGNANGYHRYFRDLDVWKRAPVLKGTTHFVPRPDVKNMVTGGAGFV